MKHLGLRFCTKTCMAGLHDDDSLPAKALTASQMNCTLGDDDFTKDSTSLVNTDVDIELIMLVHAIHR
jgi:hypothetical protein